MKRLGLGLLTSALAAAAFSPFAQAADLPVPAGPPPVSYYRPALYDWTGLYLGGNIGAGLLNDTFSQCGISGRARDDPWIIGNITNNPAGSLVGGRPGRLQLRIRALGDRSRRRCGRRRQHIGATNSVGDDCTGTGVLFENLNLEPDQLDCGAATGRVGYAHADSWLFYVKGGGDWMNASATARRIVAGGISGPDANRDRHALRLHRRRRASNMD